MGRLRFQQWLAREEVMKPFKLFPLLIALVFLPVSQAAAVAPAEGEEALFTTSVSPDALIVLDLSGSMNWNPAGYGKTYGHSESCTADTTNCSGSYCSGGYCKYSKTGCSSNCSRLQIAKKAIFGLLDDNNDGTINSSDEGSLQVRIGYMNFYKCGSDDTGGSYTSGCIQIPGTSSSRRYIGSKYSQIYCNSNTSCTVSSTGSYSVGGASAEGGTPVASALSEAKIYLDAHKAADTAGACRQKFVIFIGDGSDTFACSGIGGECQEHQYKRRRASVEKAKALADAGYKVFVIGFGAGMPDYLKNTLNWMAYYGGTDNPNQPNSAITTPYDPSVSSCTTDSSATTATCYEASGSHSTTSFQAGSNDPGYINLSGYAFLASDADQLSIALKTALNIVREATYSFSQSSVQSSRTQDENFLYEGSFQPVANDPFWLGHLKKYQINTDGTVGSVLWDAGLVLQSTDAGARMVKTYTGSSLVDFNTTNMTPALLGVSTTTERDAVVGYFRGNAAYNPDNWKLGDVFRSTPITVGTPSAFFDDALDVNNAFAAHRANHQRTSTLGNRLIVAGANDGQFHAFKTSDGSEAWSFIPPNLLSKLKNIAHTSHPTSLTHQYFVDGAVTVADVWLGSGDGSSKSAADWKTILVFGEGRGSTDRLWSSSTACDSDLVGVYDAGHPYYCGLYALNITDTLNPTPLWSQMAITPSPSQAPYLGESWSKMMTGRVRVGGNEKWVGFIGGGYNGGDCSGGGACDTRGKGFFVIDLANGHVLWSYTRADNADLDYSMPAQPAIVDTDNDGFIDMAYLGDLGGNMWRFKFCRASDGASCGTSDWAGGYLLDSATGAIRPIYTSAAVAKDTSGRLWVYWGTGDKTDPTAASAQEHFYGVIDADFATAQDASNVDNLSTATDVWDPVNKPAGWRIQLNGHGEKILADPTVFGGVVYFTTFVPSNSSDPCEQGGDAYLYGVKYTTGGGGISTGTDSEPVKSMYIGSGIPSAPVISLKPGSGGSPDMYVTVSGGGGVGANTFRVDMNPPGVANRSNMLYWLDRRLK